MGTSTFDPTAAVLAELSPQARRAAHWLVWATRTAGYPVIVTSGRRTSEEQRALVEQGLSRTLRSRHLDGNAFDIDWLGWGRDEIPAQFWRLVGPWAEDQLGLVWGGRWLAPYDPGHFELP